MSTCGTTRYLRESRHVIDFSIRARLATALMLLAGIAVVCQTAHADDLYDGYKAYDRGDYATAYRQYSKAYSDGNRFAPLYLGILYLNGHGTSKDYDKARQLFVEALNDNPAQANCALGTMYLFGYGVSKSNQTAFQYFAKSLDADTKRLIDQKHWCGPNLLTSLQQTALAGDARAQFYLGQIYETGTLAAKNTTEALRLYQLAASQGVSAAALRVNAIQAQRDELAESERALVLCKAKDECSKYGAAQRECAAAGDIDRCVQIKLSGKVPSIQCTSDGTGELLLSPASVPSAITCAYYRSKKLLE